MDVIIYSLYNINNIVFCVIKGCINVCKLIVKQKCFYVLKKGTLVERTLLPTAVKVSVRDFAS